MAVYQREVLIWNTDHSPHHPSLTLGCGNQCADVVVIGVYAIPTYMYEYVYWKVWLAAPAISTCLGITDSNMIHFLWHLKCFNWVLTSFETKNIYIVRYNSHCWSSTIEHAGGMEHSDTIPSNYNEIVFWLAIPIKRHLIQHFRHYLMFQAFLYESITRNTKIHFVALGNHDTTQKMHKLHVVQSKEIIKQKLQDIKFQYMYHNYWNLILFITRLRNKLITNSDTHRVQRQ